MIPGPCSTCMGFCCANHDEKFAPSLRYQHSGMKWHSCPDCYDGTHEICPEPEPAPQPVRTAEDERADALAWLRAQAVLPGASPDEKNMLRYAVRALRNGDHIGAAKKGKP